MGVTALDHEGESQTLPKGEFHAVFERTSREVFMSLRSAEQAISKQNISDPSLAAEGDFHDPQGGVFQGSKHPCPNADKDLGLSGFFWIDPLMCVSCPFQEGREGQGEASQNCLTFPSKPRQPDLGR